MFCELFSLHDSVNICLICGKDRVPLFLVLILIYYKYKVAVYKRGRIDNSTAEYTWTCLIWADVIILTILFRIQIKAHKHIHLSSSSSHAISTDIPKPLSPPLPIVHCFRQVFRAISHIGTELL